MTDGTRDLRERLTAAGAILGFEIVVTDDARWTVEGDALHVGLGWYAERGVPVHEAAPLALLALWEGPRAVRTAIARERRIRALGARYPETVPLLAATARLLASSELLAALPGWRSPLTAGLLRQGPAAPGELPRHLQWVALLLARGARAVGGASPEAADAAGLAPEVDAEWAGLGGSALPAQDLLVRALRPDPSRSSLERFERALGLLLPAYRRLLARDLTERGLGAGEGTAVGDADAAEGAGAEGLAAPGGGADADEADGAGDAGDDDGSDARDASDERARKGEGRQAAEGADLFAAEQAGFVSAVLETPMPAGGALLEAAIALDPASQAATPAREDPLGGGSSGASAPAPTAAREYGRRVAQLAEPIERMRAVWDRIIDERLGHRPALSRTPLPEGEELAVDALGPALAELAAGSPRPAAFRSRVRRSRRERRSGSTDYVLLVDRSASMQGAPARAAADAMIVLAESLAGVARDIDHAEARTGIGLDLDVRTALIAFDAEPEILKPLSRGIDDRHRRALHGASGAPGGATNDAAALRAAAREFGIDGPGADGPSAAPRSAPDGLARTRVLIVVSDGGTNDPAAAARELARLRAAGVRIHGLGVGADELSGRYGSEGIRIRDARELPAAMLDLIERGLR